MLNYAASPELANTRYPWSKHGPHLGGEWWISDDGFQWRRPFREVHASGEANGIVRHAPMYYDGQLLWIYSDGIYGLPENRIFYAGSFASAAFSTPSFVLPESPLALDAAFGFHSQERRGMRGQGYIMAEIMDEEGHVLEGFEKERCIIHDLESEAVRYGQMQGHRIRLSWQGETTEQLGSSKVQLRLYLRDARIYALSTA